MIKLRHFKEKWVDALKFTPVYGGGFEGTYYDVYKNPTVSEFKEIGISAKVLSIYGRPTGFRAVILRDGDLYTVSPNDKAIHDDLLEIFYKLNIIGDLIKDWYKNKESLNSFLCVVLENPKSTIFHVAESYNYEVLRPLDAGYLEDYQNNFKNKTGYKLERKE